MRLALIFVIAYLLCGAGYSAEQDGGFTAATGVEEIQQRQRLLPDDDIWWTVTGEQMGWMHRNVHQLFPTVNVYRAGQVRQLNLQIDPAIAQFEVETRYGNLAFADFLAGDFSTAMGVVILHRGEIVYENYPRMQSYEKPIYWSVTKVMTSTVLRLFEERGRIDVEQQIQFYIPELAHSDIARVTVRNILDMATGLDCQDEYDDRQSCYYQYSMAIGDGFREGNAPDNPYDFVKTLRVSKHDEQGQRFSYSGMNTFVLAWLVEKITGEPFQDVFTREIWQHIGAEADASFLAYRYGIPLTHGGLLSNMRDLARFGLLFTPSYDVVSDKQIISEQHIDLLLNGANPNLVRGNGSHNIYQWDRVDQNGFMYKGGWGGQGLIVNPKLDLVAVFTSYFKEDNSQQALSPIMFQVLNGVFAEN
ncbi:MAG: serine hydrolase domain-containing protein [Gammaproteobacteria bacterium]|jgi:CubicO group peptidase (beta-lactamase class C family)|nr:hypothetical protein [Gammaproteobacteria bacterium]MDP6095080.1 serine hydrolase domain-containing protein [Gammaproteobacteria bacterium]HJO12986.1 serine hydrolase domain-containing protein [Gammaproteobacteria bacterium]|tara:strand:+ start:659 stop:1912 length:1254 start_codon:yes stop_codon:yes gene_type:complete